METIDNDGDQVPDEVNMIGNENDVGDMDDGPNGGMNHPTLNKLTVDGNILDISYDLDTNDSPSNQYRVEFFASNEEDVGFQGLGMGEVYLGFTTVSPADGLNYQITLPNGFSMNGKVLSATATAIDNTISTGFGSTSRFSKPIAVSIDSTNDGQSPNNGNKTDNKANIQPNSNSGQLSNTGLNSIKIIIIGLVILSTVIAVYLSSIKNRLLYKSTH